ncbi:hypothetical protein IW261DRAFT_1608969 [Armillaria novae-zelandiae]|uniref:DUF6534 domain-containing protein n=1 Tax=Armillaria novae-zelandiae TaxID=153914 RepID=A0AA39TBA3_9AGAR|nr:hypothetical protein IW261DRAFT_1608969 [Armillaria novae-zelandiae]
MLLRNMTVSRTLSVDVELHKPTVAGNFVATLHSSMPSFNSTLVEDAGVAPSELYKLTGPLLIGCFLSLVLYGILCDQVYIYYISFPKDNLTPKMIVYLLWVTETAQTAATIYYTFDTFCYKFGNLGGLDDVAATWFTIPIMSGLVGCIAQLFYAWRMYQFSKKARWLCITLSVIAFIQFSAAICCGIQVRNSGHYSNLQNSSGVKVTAIIWLGGSVLCDTAIALCMTYLLCRAQTGLKSTQVLLSRLMRLSIETGTVTAVFAILDMILYLTSQNNNYYTVPANCLVKVYSNAVLAVCNSRMTGRIRGGREDIATLHSFDTFDLSIGKLNVEFRDDTETNTNADSSVQPGVSQRSANQEKTIGLDDSFINTASTADVLGTKLT